MSVFKIQFYRDGERCHDVFAEARVLAEHDLWESGQNEEDYQHATITELKEDRTRVLRGCYVLIGREYALVSIDGFDRSLERAREAS